VILQPALRLPPDAEVTTGSIHKWQLSFFNYLKHLAGLDRIDQELKPERSNSSNDNAALVILLLIEKGSWVEQW
jgi:hypothetical protein